MAILGKSRVGCSCERSGGGAKAQADRRRRRPAGQASAGATLELWPRGTWWPRKGPQQGWGEDERARAPAAPGPAPPLAPRQQRPSSPRPRPSRRPPPAHRGSGLRPPRAPSAAPLRRRCRRRHLPPAAVTQRRRCTSRAAGKWSPAPRPVPAPTACRVGSRPPSPGVHRGGRHFRPSSAMPLGKCSPWRAGAGRK